MNGHLHMHSELSTIIGNYWDCEKFVILGFRGGVSIRLRPSYSSMSNTKICICLIVGISSKFDIKTTWFTRLSTLVQAVQVKTCKIVQYTMKYTLVLALVLLGIFSGKW